MIALGKSTGRLLRAVLLQSSCSDARSETSERNGRTQSGPGDGKINNLVHCL
jgi:hypothetical protein